MTAVRCYGLCRCVAIPRDRRWRQMQRQRQPDGPLRPVSPPRRSRCSPARGRPGATRVPQGQARVAGHSVAVRQPAARPARHRLKGSALAAPRVHERPTPLAAAARHAAAVTATNPRRRSGRAKFASSPHAILARSTHDDSEDDGDWPRRQWGLDRRRSLHQAVDEVNPKQARGGSCVEADITLRLIVVTGGSVENGTCSWCRGSRAG